MKMRAISPELFSRTFSSFSDQDKALVMLGLSTGARIGELVRIKFSDFRFVGLQSDGTLSSDSEVIVRHIVEKKRKKHSDQGQDQYIEKFIPIDIYRDYLYQYLDNLRRSGATRDDYIFKSRLNRPLSRFTIYRRLKAILGTGYGTHCLRKTYAKNLYQEYRDQGFSSFEAVEKVRADLDHRYVETTAKYIGIEDEDRRLAKTNYLRRYRVS